MRASNKSSDAAWRDTNDTPGNGALGNTAVTVGFNDTIGGDGSLASTLVFENGAQFAFDALQTLTVAGLVTFEEVDCRLLKDGAAALHFPQSPTASKGTTPQKTKPSNFVPFVPLAAKNLTCTCRNTRSTPIPAFPI